MIATFVVGMYLLVWRDDKKHPQTPEDAIAFVKRAFESDIRALTKQDRPDRLTLIYESHGDIRSLTVRETFYPFSSVQITATHHSPRSEVVKLYIGHSHNPYMYGIDKLPEVVALGRQFLCLPQHP